jgi:hypothetical protein
MTLMPSHCEVYVRDYLKLSKHRRQLIMRWKTVLVNRFEGWGTRWQNTNELMTKSLKDMSRTHNSPISRFLLGQGSTCQSSGSNVLTVVTSPATQLMMAHKTLHTLCPSMHPCYPQMICQLDLFCDGSGVSSLGHTLNSYRWLKVHRKWMIGESQPTSSTTKSMTKNTRKSIQKSINSS